MPWTQADVDALQAAITAGGGVRSITFQDQTLTFNSIDEMLKLLAVMRGEVAAASGTPLQRFAVTSKGA